MGFPPGGLPQILLFVPFYTPADQQRREEILRALSQNLSIADFARIILLVDDGIEPPQLADHAQVLAVEHFPRRPTFADWILAARRHAPPGSLVLCANSDISFPAGLALSLARELPRDSGAFLACSRHELPQPGEQAPRLRSMSHRSQDAWGLWADELDRLDSAHLRDLAIPFGEPRCDGRVSFIFHIRGWDLFNPCRRLVLCHHHSAVERSYDGYGTNLLGGVCYVHPNRRPGQRSALELDLYTLSPRHPLLLGCNRMLIGQRLPSRGRLWAIRLERLWHRLRGHDR